MIPDRVVWSRLHRSTSNASSIECRSCDLAGCCSTALGHYLRALRVLRGSMHLRTAGGGAEDSTSPPATGTRGPRRSRAATSGARFPTCSAPFGGRRYGDPCTTPRTCRTSGSSPLRRYRFGGRSAARSRARRRRAIGNGALRDVVRSGGRATIRSRRRAAALVRVRRLESRVQGGGRSGFHLRDGALGDRARPVGKSDGAWHACARAAPGGIP